MGNDGGGSAERLPARKPRWSNFEAVQLYFRESFDEAKRQGEVWPNDANSVVKRLVYSYVRWGLHHDKLDSLEAFVRSQYSDQRGLKSTNPFLWGLRLVDGNDDRAAKLHKQQRSRFAWMMQYAHQHDVSPENLAVFARSVGSYKNARDRIKSDHSPEAWSAPLRAPRKTARRAARKSPAKRGAPAE